MIFRTLLSVRITNVLTMEFNQLLWEVIGIAETHWLNSDDKMVEGYRIVSSGPVDGRHRSGVAIILGKVAQKSIIGYEPVSDRIITARFKTQIGYMTICQVYAPTADSSDEELDNFYSQLQLSVDGTPTGDMLIVMGDFNAKVGQQWEDGEGMVGKFGMGDRNGRGDRLVAFCTINGLYISNTLFKQTKANRIWTWESPGGNSRWGDARLCIITNIILYLSGGGHDHSIGQFADRSARKWKADQQFAFC